MCAARRGPDSYHVGAAAERPLAWVRQDESTAMPVFRLRVGQVSLRQSREPVICRSRCYPSTLASLRRTLSLNLSEQTVNG